jgi:broad-specificity NMP kinase
MGSIFSSMRLFVVVGGGPGAGKTTFLRRLRDVTARGLSSDAHDTHDAGNADEAADESGSSNAATPPRAVVNMVEAALDFEAPVVAVRCAVESALSLPSFFL